MQGRVIADQYQILRVLREGGMGVVCEAVDTRTSLRIAIKILHGLQPGRDIEIVRRFARESRATAALDHPNIVRVFDAGTDQATGDPYLVMELLEGEDLRSLIGRVGAIEPSLALRIVAQTCLGLENAHTDGVIHRDIKPANLFLTKAAGGRSVTKILDFGIAKVTQDVLDGDETEYRTRTGSMLGTSHYMSPEQALGLKTIDHRTDIYSLGIVLYKALAGQTPFTSLETAGDVLIAVCTQSIRPIQDIAPWIPPEVAEIVHRAAARVPEERYPSVDAMLEAVLALSPSGIEIGISELGAVSDESKAFPAARLDVSSLAKPVVVPSEPETAAASRGLPAPPDDAHPTVSPSPLPNPNVHGPVTAPEPHADFRDFAAAVSGPSPFVISLVIAAAALLGLAAVVVLTWAN